MKCVTAMWIVFALTLALNGCMRDPVSEQELIGTYRAELPDGATESLELLATGECIQAIRLQDGVVYDARGTWKFDQKKGRLYLNGTRQALTASKKLKPHLSEPPSDATLGTPVYRRLGGIAIMLHEGIDYHKEARAP